jgi:hypothetical protein
MPETAIPQSLFLLSGIPIPRPLFPREVAPSPRPSNSCGVAMVDQPCKLQAVSTPPTTCSPPPRAAPLQVGLAVGVGILKPKTESKPEPNPSVYSGFRVRVRFLYVLYFGVWIRVRFLTFKTRIDLITRNIKKLLICDGIIT